MLAVRKTIVAVNNKGRRGGWEGNQGREYFAFEPFEELGVTEAVILHIVHLYKSRSKPK